MATAKPKDKKKHKKAPAPVVTTTPAPAAAAPATAPTKARRERGEATPPRPVDDALGQAIADRLVERGEKASWSRGKLTFAGATAAALFIEDDGGGRSRIEWDGESVPFRKGADAKQTVLSVAAKLIRYLDD